jgi:hypothetical protein
VLSAFISSHFIVGKRDAYHAKAFISDLAGRLKKRVQVSSDFLAAYPPNLARDASNGSGDFRPRLELGRNCWFVALIFGRL